MHTSPVVLDHDTCILFAWFLIQAHDQKENKQNWRREEEDQEFPACCYDALTIGSLVFFPLRAFTGPEEEKGGQIDWGFIVKFQDKIRSSSSWKWVRGLRWYNYCPVCLSWLWDVGKKRRRRSMLEVPLISLGSSFSCRLSSLNNKIVSTEASTTRDESIPDRQTHWDQEACSSSLPSLSLSCQFLV